MKKKTALPDDEKFCQSMRELREALEWSQSRLADELNKAGLSEFYPATVRRIELGERPVRLGEALIISQVMGSTLDEMLGQYSEPEFQRFERVKRRAHELDEDFEALVTLLARMSSNRKSLFAYFALYPYTDELELDDREVEAAHAVQHYTVWNAAVEAYKKNRLAELEDELSAHPGSPVVIEISELQSETAEDMGIRPYAEATGLQFPEPVVNLREESIGNES